MHTVLTNSYDVPSSSVKRARNWNSDLKFLRDAHTLEVLSTNFGLEADYSG
jgi:hypothetical protein